MNKLNIALLAGGDSSEREVSLRSAKFVAGRLDREKYNIYHVDIHGLDWKCTAPSGHTAQVDRNDFSVVVEGERVRFDFALIIIHGTPGEDGRLQGYLDMTGVPYSSCGMTSSVITFDKSTAKRAVAGTGINLARELFIRRGERPDPAQMVAGLGLPMFVKPNASGSSCGVTKVCCMEEVIPAVEAALAESDEALAEEFVAGREFGCGVMVAGGREWVFPLTEIVPHKEFFDYEAKYTAGFSEEITPAKLDEHIAAEIRRMALAAYRACRCSGVVRVDFIVTPEGKPYMIEVNSIPGMSAESIIPKQLAAAGMSVGELYDIIIADRLSGHDH
ncbi:MAG: D-alanine--D-alanine ligase [Rikenellaceae bacterium]|jgi:D-alanine-D-alanine ligase|nr:D-alanine--D-alanine ligase [Rikenellaceae bacterium]